MAHFPPHDSSTHAPSYADEPIMTQDEREYYLNQMEAIWSRFGGPYSRPPFYGPDPLPGEHPIQWDQMPSSSQPGPPTSRFVSLPVPNPPPPIPQPAQSVAPSTGQSVFRMAIRPDTTPSSSSRNPGEPLQTRFSVLPPAITRCTCTFPTGTTVSRMSRHWVHSCPDNPNLAVYECEYCGVEIRRSDNLRRHLRTIHGVDQ